MTEEYVNIYTYCPYCLQQATARTRGIPTYDMCDNRHRWLVSDGVVSKKDPLKSLTINSLTDAQLIAAAPDLYLVCELSKDYEALRHCGYLSDEAHALFDKWRDAINEKVGGEFPLSERYPGWEKEGMATLLRVTRDAALAKGCGEATNET